MKRIDNRKTDTNIIRVESTTYGDSVDTIQLISYPNFLLISWSIASSTRNFLEQILKEDFEDLHMRIILYKTNNQQQMTDFHIRDISGILRLELLPTGTYYGEIVTSNSQNETITIKRSSSLYFLQEKSDQSKKYEWKQHTLDEQSWLRAYSSYTIYD
jgi:hypothetical protein